MKILFLKYCKLFWTCYFVKNFKLILFNGFYSEVYNFQWDLTNIILGRDLSEFVNEEFKFQIHFDNIGNETGFGPIVYLTLPPEFKNAKFLGSSVKATFVEYFHVILLYIS